MARAQESGDPRFWVWHGLVHGGPVPLGTGAGDRPLRGGDRRGARLLPARAVHRRQRLRDHVSRRALRRGRVAGSRGARRGSSRVPRHHRADLEARRLPDHHDGESPGDGALGLRTRPGRPYQVLQESPRVQTDAARPVPRVAHHERHADRGPGNPPPRELLQAQYRAGVVALATVHRATQGVGGVRLHPYRARPETAVRIGVFGHVGNQNLGDEALIAAVVQNVRRRYPGAELRAFTARPHDTEQRHGIPAFPIRRMNGRPANARPPSAPARAGGDLGARLKRVPLLPVLVRALRRLGTAAQAVILEVPFLVQSYRHLRGTDLLLIAGSQQLNDYWGGPWGFPFTLFKWLLLARASGTKVAFLSVGAGPLRTRLGKFFVKQTLRLAAYRSYRDDDSQRCVAALGIPGEHLVVPDLVFSLEMGRPPAPRAPARRPVVGVNPMPD